MYLGLLRHSLLKLYLCKKCLGYSNKQSPLGQTVRRLTSITAMRRATGSTPVVGIFFCIFFSSLFSTVVDMLLRFFSSLVLILFLSRSLCPKESMAIRSRGHTISENRRLGKGAGPKLTSQQRLLYPSLTLKIVEATNAPGKTSSIQENPHTLDTH